METETVETTETETKSIWNKKANEITIGDAVKVNLVVGAVMLGGVVAIATVPVAVEAAVNKFRSVRLARDLKKLEKTESKTKTPKEK